MEELEAKTYKNMIISRNRILLLSLGISSSARLIAGSAVPGEQCG